VGQTPPRALYLDVWLVVPGGRHTLSMERLPEPSLVVLRALSREELEALEGDVAPPGLILNPAYRISWWISPLLRGVEDPENYAPFVVLRASDHLVIGRLSIEPKLKPPVISMVEICDALKRHGFGRAAIGAALDLFRARSDVLAVRAVILHGNIPSERAFAACGFMRTGEKDGQIWEWRR